MTEQTNQEGQKTVVSFIAGLLVGGLLVWIFSETPAEAPMLTDDADPTEETTEAEVDENGEAIEMDESETATNTEDQMQTGDAEVALDTVPAGTVLELQGATYPTDEGWIAVRTYTNGKLGWVLGASRYSKSQGLAPETVELLSPMVAGRDYAVVFFSEDGDRTFDLATDVQLDTDITTFTAQ